MVNTNIQGPIPLDGRGFTAKPNRNYEAGEYRRLSNAQLKDGTIQSRYAVRNYYAEGAVSPTVQNAHPFVGFIDDCVFVTTKDDQYYYKVGAAARGVAFDPNDLGVPAVGFYSFHKVIGCFEYNESWYWLTWRYTDSAAGLSEFKLYHCLNTEDFALDGVTRVGKSVAFVSLTPVVIFTLAGKDVKFNNFFIFKERLWVSTNKGLYYSKSIDPTIFTVPDGGFFKIRDQNITHCFSSKDSIFILCDSSIHVLNYSSDPTTDGSVREISSTIGGDHGVSFRDQAYVTNTDGIFAVSSNSVDLIRDDFETAYVSPNSKLVAWENYLILIRYTSHNYAVPVVENDIEINAFKDRGRIREQTAYNVLDVVDSNVWFINMETGACHTLDFNDQFDGIQQSIPVNSRGHIMDIIVNPNKNPDRKSVLTIMTSRYYARADVKSQIYYMDNVDSGFKTYDTVVNAPGDNIVRRMKPYIWIEIDAYTPDGNEYQVKKFRSLEIMGAFPSWDFGVGWVFDNMSQPDSYLNSPLVIDPAAITTADVRSGIPGSFKSPYPFRIGLNQRGRSIGILLSTSNPRTPIPVEKDGYERIEVTDMRVLWTYTGRGPTNKSGSSRP